MYSCYVGKSCRYHYIFELVLHGLYIAYTWSEVYFVYQVYFRIFFFTASIVMSLEKPLEYSFYALLIEDI